MNVAVYTKFPRYAGQVKSGKIKNVRRRAPVKFNQMSGE